MSNKVVAVFFLIMLSIGLSSAPRAIIHAGRGEGICGGEGGGGGVGVDGSGSGYGSGRGSGYGKGSGQGMGGGSGGERRRGEEGLVGALGADTVLGMVRDMGLEAVRRR